MKRREFITLIAAACPLPGRSATHISSERGFEAGEAGDVPTRLVEPRDDAAGDGVEPDRQVME
jgi:hypothetical protein